MNFFNPSTFQLISQLIINYFYWKIKINKIYNMKPNKIDERTLFLNEILLNNHKSVKKDRYREHAVSELKQQESVINSEKKMLKKRMVQTPATVSQNKSPKKITNFVLQLNLNCAIKNNYQQPLIKPQKISNIQAINNQIKFIYAHNNGNFRAHEAKHQDQLKKKKKNNIMETVRSKIQDYIDINKEIFQSQQNQIKIIEGYSLMKLPSIDMQKAPTNQGKKNEQGGNKVEQSSQPSKEYQQIFKSKNVYEGKSSKNFSKGSQDFLTYLSVDTKDRRKKDIKTENMNRNEYLVIQQKSNADSTQMHTNNKLEEHVSPGNYSQKLIKFEMRRQKKSGIFKQKQYTVYQHKIKSYRDFIFQINFAHNYFDPVILKQEFGLYKNQEKRFKAFIGKGNNSLLIKSLLKRRFWWTIVEDSNSANFSWTQTKLNDYFKLQKSNKISEQNSSQQTKKLVLTEKKFRSKKKKNQLTDSKPKNKFKPSIAKGTQKIFNASDIQIFKKYQNQINNDERMDDFENRKKIMEKKLTIVNDKFEYKVHNHLQFNYFIGNKKALFYNMRQYYSLKNQNVFDYLPLTFHIKKGVEDKQFKEFVRYFRKKQQEIGEYQESQDHQQKKNQNIWIVKPGENSNRGNGITVINKISQLHSILKKKQFHPNGTLKTYIVQSYIDKPFLYHRRKFDIRHYMLITTLYGKMRGYWYSQGYIRTSCYQFDLDDLQNEMIHLTNDAIQKNCEDYGKFEQGNKISYVQFQKYLDNTYPQKYNFYQQIYPKMKQIATDAIRAGYLKLDPHKLEHNFEIFGLDFMIDSNFQVWLIEINTNPCLEISSNLLGRIIPTMVEHSFRLSIDVLFPLLAQYPNTMKHLAPDNLLQTLKYELVFDEFTEQHQLKKLYKQCKNLDYGQISEEQDLYQDQGKEIDLQNI